MSDSNRTSPSPTGERKIEPTRVPSKQPTSPQRGGEPRNRQWVRSLGVFLAISLIWFLFIAVFWWLWETSFRKLQPPNELPQTILMEVSSNVRPILPDMFCYSTSVLYGPSWTDAAFQAGVGQLSLGALRIPGGPISGFWDWKSGDVYPASPWKVGEGLERDLRDYQAGFAATGTTPVFVLNMLTATLDDQLEMLREARDMGLPVKYLELGNSFYQDGPDGRYVEAFPTAKTYNQKVERWVLTIREAFPDARIAVVGAPPEARSGERQGTWNEFVGRLAGQMGLGMTFQPYSEVQIQEKFADADVPAVLGMPFLTWRRYHNRESPTLTRIPENVPLWMTEYNLIDSNRSHFVGNTWAQGLSLATQYLVFLEDKRVDLMCASILLGPNQLAATYYNTAGEEGETSIANFTLTSNGLVAQMLGEAVKGMTGARPILFSEPFRILGANGIEYPTLLGWLFETKGRETAIILNLSGETIEVGLTPSERFPAQYLQRFGEPAKKVFGVKHINEAAGSIQDGKLSLPPYSITYLSDE